MTRHPGAAEFLPERPTLDRLADAAAGCRGCDLWSDATQIVFGTGDPAAALMLVGEQPGDQEDQQGEPFVGPAGRVLHQALDEAGLAGVATWTTNAVKHFRWRPGRGKQRLHQTPTAGQATACRPWLAHEIAAVRPQVVVALGATAASTLFGPGFRLTPTRGQRLPWPPASGSFADQDGAGVQAAFATVHPSSILRVPTEERDAAMRGLVADLTTVAAALGEL